MIETQTTVSPILVVNLSNRQTKVGRREGFVNLSQNHQRIRVVFGATKKEANRLAKIARWEAKLAELKKQ